MRLGDGIQTGLQWPSQLLVRQNDVKRSSAPGLLDLRSKTLLPVWLA
jgi:hypothetical protein